MAPDLPFGLNKRSFARKAAPFAVAALVGFSGVMAQAAEGAKPVWTGLKAKPDFATAERRVIPEAHCNYLFDRADAERVAKKKEGKLFVSKTTKDSLTAFYAFDKDHLPTCTGPREIAWETEKDRAFIGALADSGCLAFDRKVDFIPVYGFRPAARPTPTMPGPGASNAAPIVN